MQYFRLLCLLDGPTRSFSLFLIIPLNVALFKLFASQNFLIDIDGGFFSKSSKNLIFAARVNDFLVDVIFQFQRLVN